MLHGGLENQLFAADVRQDLQVAIAAVLNFLWQQRFVDRLAVFLLYIACPASHELFVLTRYRLAGGRNAFFRYDARFSSLVMFAQSSYKGVAFDVDCIIIIRRGGGETDAQTDLSPGIK